ncbi:MAG TPA: universal stress protein [Solirubrobacterales bacterium]
MKILIGHDGSEPGRDALALGREIADVLGATPLVTTVLTWPSNLMGPQDLEVAAKAETDELFVLARDYLDGLSPETCWRVNRSPAEALYEVADSEDAALIVVGSSHRGPIGRVMPGSVGASLLHGAPCGVLVAPRGFADAEERSFRKIAVAFDGSAESWTALETGIGLAERLHASLEILAVAELPRYGPSTAFAVLTVTEYRSAERDEKQRLLELGRERVPDGLPVETRLLEGEPGPQLAEAAAGADLLIVGSRGYGPLRRVLLGSASARLVGSAPCPVLVLPRGIGVDPLSVRAAGRKDAMETSG